MVDAAHNVATRTGNMCARKGHTDAPRQTQEERRSRKKITRAQKQQEEASRGSARQEAEQDKRMKTDDARAPGTRQQAQCRRWELLATVQRELGCSGSELLPPRLPDISMQVITSVVIVINARQTFERKTEVR
eukprot:2247963-Rhodomonas_salina.1